jgi:eukaryotic-like serine/threonine-protein kinase
MNEPCTPDDPLSLTDLQQVVEVCARFEDEWLAGRRPRVEDFLARAPGPMRPALLRDLLRLDLHYRRKAGEAPTAGEYHRRMPEYGAVIDAVFAPAPQTPAADALPATSPDLGATAPDLPPPAGGGVVAEVPRLELSDEDVPLTLPARAGRYLVEGVIAPGGMGVVLRARDPGLNRTLAIKVLRKRFQHEPELGRRFLEEAQVTGQLQHPGIPPVHEVGSLEEGQPFLAMKLIRGQTLDQLLKGRKGASEDLPRWLAIFLQVCQAVGYAHSRGVVHRDLKPANVMVGAFGEVQVMDWGLAKTLSSGGLAGEEASVIATARGAGEQTERGRALGTFAYMPPEQARGEADTLDERADVFGLGAILCVLLTGQPPYLGRDRDEVRRRAEAGDLSEAFARLDACGADGELVALAKTCLAPDKEGRPRDAGEVARAVAAYQAAVQERLRAAELERAAAEARAAEARAKAAAERRARRLTVGLAAAALLLVVGGGGGAWAWQRQRQQANNAVALALNDARRARERALADPLGDVALLGEALAAAQKASELARTGGASPGVRQQADDLVGELTRENEAAGQDRRLLDRLLEVRGPREGPRFKTDKKGFAVVLAEPSADEQFAEAFRDWGLDVDATPVTEAAARLKGRPSGVVTEVIAALDDWADERRQQRPRGNWQRPAAVADALDGPNSRRRELRAILVGERLPVERALGWLAAGLRPGPVPFDTGLGQQRVRLRRLAGQVDPAREPVLGLLTLARALIIARDEAWAERLLRDAVRARPREVVLYQWLGHLLAMGPVPRWGEAVECYAIVRALRPGLGLFLAHALVKSGRVQEGLALYNRLVAERPDNPWLQLQRGNDLYELNRFGEAESACRQAIALKPDYPEAHYNLGVALAGQGKLNEAEAAYREAIRLKPDFPEAHYNFGVALWRRGKPKQAEAAYREALRLKPDFPEAHNGLGVTLAEAGRNQEAEAAYRKAIDLKPDYPPAHNNLGNALGERRKYKEAEVAYREAIRLKPDFPEAHNGLGVALYRQKKLDAAIAAYRKAIDLKPDYAEAHFNLGGHLGKEGKYKEAEAACRAAVRLKPDYPEAHNRLGFALENQGRLKEAEAAYRKAIDLKPDYAEAHFDLGHTLRDLGQFAEGLAELRKGHELGSKRPGWPYPSAQWVRQCESLADLDARLPAVLRREKHPRDNAERLAFACFCYRHKKRYVAASGLYADAFAAEPKLADNLRQPHRYNAACAAALAAAGEGKDATKLGDQEKARFREQAQVWLRADLTLHKKQLTSWWPGAANRSRQLLLTWRQDPAFDSLRDKDSLAKLPADERAAWRKLWAEVDDLLKRAREAR